MTYSNLDQIKRYLNMSADYTKEDTLLSSLQESAYNDINVILSEFTDVPITDENEVKILGDIEAMWTAGLYRMRLEQRPDIPERQWSHPLIEIARKRLLTYIEKRFLGVYFKVV